MTTNILKNVCKLLGLLLLFVMPMAFTSCSDDDDTTEFSNDKEMYDHIVSAITDSEGNLYAVETSKGQRVAATESSAESHKLCEYILGSSWDGKDKTVNLGNYGSVRLMSSTIDGVYNVINFNLTGIESHTLTIASEEYLKQDNGLMDVIGNFYKPAYKCEKCGKVWRAFQGASPGTHKYFDGCDGKVLKI